MRVRLDPTARFRARAHAWFAQAPRRLALARLHGQMAALCQAEAHAIGGDEWPPRPLTPEEREEIERLMAIGDEAHDRMTKLAGAQRTSSAFYEFIFGGST
jgi:hypothetical protein